MECECMIDLIGQILPREAGKAHRRPLAAVTSQNPVERASPMQLTYMLEALSTTLRVSPSPAPLHYAGDIYPY
jgi:hypothetical protein